MLFIQVNAKQRKPENFSASMYTATHERRLRERRNAQKNPRSWLNGDSAVRSLLSFRFFSGFDLVVVRLLDADVIFTPFLRVSFRLFKERFRFVGEERREARKADFAHQIFAEIAFRRAAVEMEGILAFQLHQ